MVPCRSRSPEHADVIFFWIWFRKVVQIGVQRWRQDDSAPFPFGGQRSVRFEPRLKIVTEIDRGRLDLSFETKCEANPMKNNAGNGPE